MKFAYSAPDRVKVPPTYRFGPEPSSKLASANTCGSMPISPPIPDASEDQCAPSHLAMSLRGVPPADVKMPPAYSAGPEPSSKTVIAETCPYVPVNPGPNLDHDEPFQRAMCCAVVPPAPVKYPPTYSAGPEPSSNTASDCAMWFVPLPSGAHACPFHFATFAAGTPPAVVNEPAAYSAGPEPSS